MTTKKRSIVSFHNLPEAAQELFKEKYGNSYGDFVQKITKPNNEIMYVVPLETEDAYYMIKVEVRVDAKMSDDEFDKQLADIDSFGGEGEEKEEAESNDHDNGDGFNPNKKEYEIFSGHTLEDIEKEEAEREKNSDDEEEDEDDDEDFDEEEDEK